MFLRNSETIFFSDQAALTASYEKQKLSTRKHTTQRFPVAMIATKEHSCASTQVVRIPRVTDLIYSIKALSKRFLKETERH